MHTCNLSHHYRRLLISLTHRSQIHPYSSVIYYFFTDEIIPLPSANITPAVAINNQSFVLNCTGVGTLHWYRGNDFNIPLDNHTHLLDNNTVLLLMVNLYEDDFSQINERDHTYFCTASNSLGVARSRSIQIPCKREQEGERRGGE